MKLKGTLAYVLGSAAAGGALYYGISRLTGAKAASTAASRKMLVRVTENGRKYHRDDCPLLHGETRVINVSEALENYEPCKACHPPGGLESAADEAMDPKRAASRITSDANGTTARTTASAQMERTNSSPTASTGSATTSRDTAAAQGAAGRGGKAGAANARTTDASVDAGTTPSAASPDAAAATGIQNDPVGEASERGIER